MPADGAADTDVMATTTLTGCKVNTCARKTCHIGNAVERAKPALKMTARKERNTTPHMVKKSTKNCRMTIMTRDINFWEVAGSVLTGITYFLACPLLALLLAMVTEGF